MRIIAGKHGGRAIRVPRAEGLRPTAGRVREAVFNILEHGLASAGLGGARVIDSFAGTGAYGLEALSRGAARVTFLDIDETALLGIRRNAAAFGEARNIALLKLNATRLPSPPGTALAPCDLAFLDPPYGSGFAVAALQCLASRHWLGVGAIAVVEVAAREPLSPPPCFTTLNERTYGAARVVFLRFPDLTEKSGLDRPKPCSFVQNASLSRSPSPCGDLSAGHDRIG